MEMMRAYLSGNYWRHGFSIVKAAAAFLSMFGVLWLAIEISTFFFPKVSDSIRSAWPVFLTAGLLGAFWLNRPITSVSCKLSKRDVELRICVADIFKIPGALVVGTNTSFDTDMAAGLIHHASIQGQFTSVFYDSVAHLDADIDRALRGVATIAENREKLWKSALYPVGTVASVRPKGRTAYLIAIAELNARGVANASFDDLKVALPALWESIANSGTIEAVVIPVLGSGFSRLTETREEITREIVNSFVAGCAARRFTESLTIVMHPRDFYKNNVNIEELGRYLSHVCRYTEYGMNIRMGRGTPAG